MESVNLYRAGHLLLMTLGGKAYRKPDPDDIPGGFPAAARQLSAGEPAGLWSGLRDAGIADPPDPATWTLAASWTPDGGVVLEPDCGLLTERYALPLGEGDAGFQERLSRL